MAGLEAGAVADLLTEIGQRLELAGESPYRARAYQRAAESLRGLTTPLATVIAKGRLRDIRGVGPAIADTIVKLHETGTHPKLDAMRGTVPASALTMLRIPGVPGRRILQLHETLGAATLDELEQACRSGRVAAEKALGPALQQKLLDGLAMLRRSHGRRLIHRAAEVLQAAASDLERSRPELRRVAIAGDFRRGCEVVGDLSLVAEAPKRERAAGPVLLGSEVKLHLPDAPRYGAALVIATGSTEHVAQLQAMAAERGLTLDRDGLRRGRRLVPCPNEDDVYAALGLPPIAPELREGRGEIGLALTGRLPRLVEAADLRGVLHCHTDFSDGAHTLEQMVRAAQKRGYGYFGVADHSQAAGYAGGLTLDEINAQHALADALNARWRGRFRIFKGIEADILADGSLDYGPEVLGRFEFVVASVHSRFRLDANTQTERIIRAVADPHTTILGHMTGRMLLRRQGYEVDVERILQACAEHGVAVEVNGNPHRLDLDWRWHGRALELGCMLSINPDAHSIAELDLTRWGVLMARKGGVPPDRVLNGLDVEAIAHRFETRRAARSPKPTRRTPRQPRSPGRPRARAAARDREPAG